MRKTTEVVVIGLVAADRSGLCMMRGLDFKFGVGIDSAIILNILAPNELPLAF